MLFGDNLLKHWSNTQSVIALSSAEAAFYAVVNGACRGLGFQSLGNDLGIHFKVCVFVDAKNATPSGSVKSSVNHKCEPLVSGFNRDCTSLILQRP